MSHQLAIAKASFSAALLRPDPQPLSRNEIAQFDTLLNAVLRECSQANVQNCKYWILSNIIQSTARSAALGKYLTALSTSFTGLPKRLSPNIQTSEPSAKRKRLHILYLINDLLYHTTVRLHDASTGAKIQPMLIGLFTNAASFRNSPKHSRKILDMLELWEKQNYYSTSYIEKLRETVKIASVAAHGGIPPNHDSQSQSDGVTKTPRYIPFMMPSIHGDMFTPWYDLPAGNLMPLIVPNSAQPINPTLIKPLRFVSGPAEENLATAVQTLLNNVSMIFEGGNQDDQKGTFSDVDELGLPIIGDNESGEGHLVESYYGWSRRFCEKMRRHKRKLNHPESSTSVSRRQDRRSYSTDSRRTRSRNSSHGSLSPRQRLYSDSDKTESRGRSQDRGKVERSSYSRSYSPSRGRSKAVNWERRSRTPLQSRSRSVSRKRDSRDGQDASRTSESLIRHRSTSRRESFHSGELAEHALPWSNLASGGQDVQNIALQAPSFTSTPSGVPIHPPLPQFHGQWPPPPPPPPILYGQQSQQSVSWPPPPPHQFHAAQNWQPSPYKEDLEEPGEWVLPAQHTGNGRGYGNRGRGASNSSLQEHRGREQGYTGYGGSRGPTNGRGYS